MERFHFIYLYRAIDGKAFYIFSTLMSVNATSVQYTTHPTAGGEEAEGIVWRHIHYRQCAHLRHTHTLWPCWILPISAL